MIDEQRAYAYCIEDISKIENYELAKSDNSHIWVCHHKLEIHEDYNNTREEMIKMGIYYHRPASELIFLSRNEHHSIHNKARREEIRKNFIKCNKNRVWSQATKDKISKALTGRKRGPMSEETRNKISMARMGKHYPRKKEAE